MYFGLLILLLPLFFGYFLPINSQTVRKVANSLLNWMIYIILFLMGISLAFLDNITSNLLLIGRYAITFFLAIFCMNLLALILLERCYPWRQNYKRTLPPSRLRLILESSKFCAVVVIGFFIGLTQIPWLHFATQGSEYALIFLLFLVGIQLRGSDMTLRQLFINKHGMVISLVVAGSALLGGAIAALINHLPIKSGLAMASGFGWYSLSGILLTDSYGPIIGSAAFFNDLARELTAIMLIPTLMQHKRSAALGLCGATSMDFTLPMLQRSGGIEIVPAAIVHGFILSLLAPILIALFS